MSLVNSVSILNTEMTHPEQKVFPIQVCNFSFASTPRTRVIHHCQKQNFVSCLVRACTVSSNIDCFLLSSNYFLFRIDQNDLELIKM